MNMQNVAKLDVPEGEVRTIHDKDGNLIWGKVSYGVKYKGDTAQNGTPTPSTPVAVQTVTGEQTISINGAAHTVNLGSIELCKIGDHQDYIWKDGDDWKVHKETSKATFSDLDWYASQIGSTGHYRVHSSGITQTVLPPSANNVNFIGYCSIYANKTSSQTYARQEGCSIQGDGYANTGTIFIYDADYDYSGSATSWKTARGAGQIYFVLKTPTDTEITNQALVAQLEAVEQWLTRYGYNATVTGNLPIIIDRTVL